MSTRRESEIIHRILDGEASKSETRRLQEKMKQDPAVRQEYEGLQRIDEVTRALKPETPPPPAFRDRVLRDIRREPPRA